MVNKKYYVALIKKNFSSENGCPCRARDWKKFFVPTPKIRKLSLVLVCRFC